MLSHEKVRPMSPNDDTRNEILSTVANSAQSLQPAAARLRRTLSDLVDNAARVEAAAERIITALKRLHPPDAS